MVAFIGPPGPFELLIVALMVAFVAGPFIVAVVVVPFWRIFAKAGFHGALSLLMLVPFVNVIMIFVLAFSEWPALKSREAEEQ